MIRKLFRQMLITQIVSAMTVSICMLIDSMMIGRFLGIPSMTAYGLATPILLVFMAYGAMIAAGVQVVCGRTLGVGDKKGTNSCFTVSMLLAGGFAVLGMAAVLIFINPICTRLGAGLPTPDNEVFFLTRDYLRGFVIGGPAFILAQVMVPYMQLSGNRTRMIVAVVCMTLGDILLDILNVFVFKKGMLGMGLASSLSYYLAVLIGVAYFLKRDCIFKLRFRYFHLKLIGTLFKEGLPTLINQVSLVLMTYTFNKILLDVGQNLAVAAYSVISTAGNLCYSFSAGIGAVALTLASIFYSDTDKSSLRQLVSTVVYFSVTLCAAVTVIVVLAAHPLVRLFLEDPAATDLSVQGMRLFVLSLVPSALNTGFKNYYQGIDRVRQTLAISVCQNFLFMVLSAFILSRFFGVTGVWLAFICGETLTFLLVTLMVRARTIRLRPIKAVDAYSLLPPDFGVRDEDCFEATAVDFEEIIKASEAATRFSLDHELSTKLSMVIALCIEEMGSNIIKYGFRGKKSHNIDIRLMLIEDRVVLRIRDNCAHFDPVKYMEMHDDDHSSHIGIRMIMGMVREAKYVNSLGLNNLILTV